MKILHIVWMKNILDKTQKSEFKVQPDKIISLYWEHQSKDVKIVQNIIVNLLIKLDCASNDDID